MTIIYTPQAAGQHFGNLIDIVKAFGYGDEDEPFIKTWLNMSYLDVATRKRWSWTEATQTVTTVVGAQTVAMSSLSEIPAFHGRLKPTDSGILIPEYVDPMTFEDSAFDVVTSEVGQAQYYTIRAGLIYWYPIPEAVRSYTHWYWAIPFEMVNDTDYPLVPPQYRNVLVVGALLHAADRDHNPQLYAQRLQYYERLISVMFGHDSARDNQTKKRAAMPDSYGGAFDSRASRRA